MSMNPQMIDQVLAICSSARSAKAGFASLLDYLEQASPEADLNEIRTVDVEADGQRLINWLTALLSNDPPASDVVNIHFGLAELGDQRQWTLYVAGYRRGKEIAMDTDWWPEGRYADSTVLQAVSDGLKADALGDRLIAEYTLVLGFACLMAKELDGLVRSGRQEVQVSSGFDEGDRFVLQDSTFVAV